MSATMMETEEKVKTADFQKEARRLMESLLISQPEHYLANYGKSLLLFSEGKLLESTELLSKALSGAPEGGEMEIATMKKRIETLIPKVSAKVDQPPAMPPARATVIEVGKKIPLEIPRIEFPKPEKKQYVCEHCNKIFSKQFSLNRHRLLHSGERPFRCDKCDRGFAQQNDLDRHSSIHSLDSNFECSQCFKRFKTKKNLNGHLKTHSEERPFACTLCDKTFKAKKMLNFHLNLHTHTNTYECTQCDKKFPAKSYLKNHLKKHDETRPFKCDSCSVDFKRECDLIKHNEKHGNLTNCKVGVKQEENDVMLIAD